MEILNLIYKIGEVYILINFRIYKLYLDKKKMVIVNEKV